MVGLAMGDFVPSPFEGVGTGPPLPLLLVGALVVMSSGTAVGILVGLSIGDDVPPPFEGVGTDPPSRTLSEGVIVVSSTGA